MPELPEVQTVVSQLGKKITGKTLAGFWTDWPKKVKVAKTKLNRVLSGVRVLGTRRLGKHIVIDLGNDHSLVIHLKMTGHLLYKTKTNAKEKVWQDPMNQFIHHQFLFTDGSRVDFSDMRKFAWIDYVESPSVEKLKSIVALGCDALSGKCHLDYFEVILQGAKKKYIAVLLLEQDKIAGIGNIYRSEMLYRSGIRPLRRTGTLTRIERAKLFQSMKEVLREAEKLRGTTDGDFRDTFGKPGAFQAALFVYGRGGKPCKRCGTIIIRKKIGQRSVFYCPECQK